MVKKCGVVAVIGEPNVGKSTFVNAMVGTKIAIVSPKVQTTRRSVMGIALFEETQIVFVDSPGIFSPSSNFEAKMVKVAWNTPHGADLILILVDICSKDLSKSIHIIEKTARLYPNNPIAVLLNKIDKRPRDILLQITAQITKETGVDKIFMISARKGSGFTQLKEHLVSIAPTQEWLYDGDQVSNISLAKFAAEITRGHIFKLLGQELPYSIEVETTKWEEQEHRIDIHQDILVDSSSRKKIIIGEKGQMLKDIGTRSRKELQAIIGKKINLFSYVKIDKRWQEKVDIY